MTGQRSMVLASLSGSARVSYEGGAHHKVSEAERIRQEREADADFRERLLTDPDMQAEYAFWLGGGRDPQGPKAG